MAGSKTTEAAGPPKPQTNAPTRMTTGARTSKKVAVPNVSEGTPLKALVPTDWMALAAASNKPMSAICRLSRSPRRRRAVSSRAPLHARVKSWSTT